MANRLRPPVSPLQAQIKNNDAIEFEFNYYWYDIVALLLKNIHRSTINLPAF